MNTFDNGGVDNELLSRANAGDVEAIFEVANLRAFNDQNSALKWLKLALTASSTPPHHRFAEHDHRLSNVTQGWELSFIEDALNSLREGKPNMAKNLAVRMHAAGWFYEVYPLCIELVRKIEDSWAAEVIAEDVFAKFVDNLAKLREKNQLELEEIEQIQIDFQDLIKVFEGFQDFAPYHPIAFFDSIDYALFPRSAAMLDYAEFLKEFHIDDDLQKRLRSYVINDVQMYLLEFPSLRSADAIRKIVSSRFEDQPLPDYLFRKYADFLDYGQIHIAQIFAEMVVRAAASIFDERSLYVWLMLARVKCPSHLDLYLTEGFGGLEDDDFKALVTAWCDSAPCDECKNRQEPLDSKYLQRFYDENLLNSVQ
jgi:hypothetical protein